jgi:hypothetical protein
MATTGSTRRQAMDPTTLPLYCGRYFAKRIAKITAPLAANNVHATEPTCPFRSRDQIFKINGTNCAWLQKNWAQRYQTTLFDPLFLFHDHGSYHVVWQGPLQGLRLIPRSTHPNVSLLLGCQEHASIFVRCLLCERWTLNESTIRKEIVDKQRICLTREVAAA